MKLKSYLNIVAIPIQGCTNPLANNYDINAVIDDGSCTFTPQSITAIISDTIPSHAIIVKEAFDDTYLNDNAVVYNQRDEDLFEFGEAIGIKAMIKSYTGLFSHIPLATQYYPSVPFFMPLGSNQNIELTNPSTLSVIVSCGAGLTDRNLTGYGNGLEFWDIDTYNVPTAESSFSTPIIAGKILNIMEARNCDFWEARYVARITADRNEPNRPANTIWHNLNGFGKINVANAIAYNGSVPPDPYLNNGNVMNPFRFNFVYLYMENIQQRLKERYTYRDGNLYFKEKGKTYNVGDKAGSLNKKNGYVYVRFNGGKKLLHRLIFAYFNNYMPKFIDHIDGNNSNNMIENLRPCTASQNGGNSRKNKSYFSTPYKGVSIAKRKFKDKYRAIIRHMDKNIHLGFFDTEIEAAQAYNKKALELHGEFARLNQI